MLAVCRGEPRVLGMVLMRARDIDDLDLRVGAERVDGFVGRATEVRLETLPRLRPRIGGGDHGDPWVLLQRRQHDGEGAAEAGDTHADAAGCC